MGAPTPPPTPPPPSQQPLRTFVLYVEDKPGVLDRVASLFRRRNWNIESLHVVRTDRPGISRMTVEVRADTEGGQRITAHLHKLINVLSVKDVTLENEDSTTWQTSSTTRTRTSG
jgi:acetolactate synthase-1/3 small subunit